MGVPVSRGDLSQIDERQGWPGLLFGESGFIRKLAQAGLIRDLACGGSNHLESQLRTNRRHLRRACARSMLSRSDSSTTIRGAGANGRSVVVVQVIEFASIDPLILLR